IAYPIGQAMNYLETARKVYARVKARRNGRFPHLRACSYPYVVNAFNAESPPADLDASRTAGDHLQHSQDEVGGEAAAPEPTASGPRTVNYCPITDPEDLDAVLAALADADCIGIDLETTGLDPRTDRARLLSVALPTIDGGAFAYLVDCSQVNPQPL